MASAAIVLFVLVLRRCQEGTAALVELDLLAKFASLEVTQHVADCAECEREVAEAGEHSELYIKQGSRAFADGPNCVCELVGHQAVREPVRGGQ
eukprot:166269-Pleurochrysis_carterae.AAC.1